MCADLLWNIQWLVVLQEGMRATCRLDRRLQGGRRQQSKTISRTSLHDAARVAGAEKKAKSNAHDVPVRRRFDRLTRLD